MAPKEGTMAMDGRGAVAERGGDLRNQLEAQHRASVLLQDAREAVMRGLVRQCLQAIDAKQAEVERLQTEIRIHKTDLRHLANGDLDLIRQGQETDPTYRETSCIPVDRLPMVPKRYAVHEQARAGVFPTHAEPMQYEIAGTQWIFKLPVIVDYEAWLRALSGTYLMAPRPGATAGSAYNWSAADYRGLPTRDGRRR